MSAAQLLDFDSETMPARSQQISISQPRVETYSYVMTQGSNRFATPVSPLPLFTFAMHGEIKRLRQPLHLRVGIEEGQYFVENDALRLFGNGATLMDAVRAFSSDLAYFWRHYRSLRPDQVAGEGVRLKQIYDELIEQ